MIEYRSPSILSLEEITNQIKEDDPKISPDSLAIQVEEEFKAQSISEETGADFPKSIKGQY